MMIAFHKAIPRRTFLRGAGAALALPLLDSMIPAFAKASDSDAKPPTRLAFMYVPNGIIMDKWTPAVEGSGFEFTPILQPLSSFRKQLLVLTGLDSKEAWAIAGLDNTGDHARACSAFLTGTYINSRSKELSAGISVDQLAAREMGKYTELASLELGIESAEILGTCDGGCSYTNTICWRDAKTPLPMQNDPRAVFERLFGSSDRTDPQERLARIQKKRSVLDFVTHETTRLMGDLGANDRTKVDQYLDAIRDTERRIQKAEEQSGRELPSVERPAGVPGTIEEHLKLMFELQTLAYQADLTRISALQVGHEMGSQAYPELGISDPYHPLTHHQGDREKIAKVITVNIFHAKMLAAFLEKLQSTPEGDGTLLDHSMIVYGSGLSDGNMHVCVNLPVLLAGGSAVGIKGGRHIKYPKGTPMTNLDVLLLNKMGIPAERFGNSDGVLDVSSV